jgi:hypothetical protein
MNLLKDTPRLWEVMRNFKTIEKRREFGIYFENYTSKDRNPWFEYKRITPAPDEILFSMHNHTDGYSLFEVAEVAAARGYKFFAITNHSDDSQFNGKRIIYSKDHDIFLLRGIECRCQEPSLGTEEYFSINEGKYKTRKILGQENDIVLVGYRGHIDSFKPFQETLDKASQNNSFIQVTAPFNPLAKGPSEKKIGSFLPIIDAVEIFDSNNASYLCYSDIIAAKWLEETNSRLNSEYKVPGIFVNDAHTLREIGCAGTGFKIADFIKFIENPSYTVNHADELLEVVRFSLRANRYTNYGYYFPRFSILYPDKIRAILRDMILRPFDSDEGEWEYSEDRD